MKKVYKIANRIRNRLGADFMLPPAEKGGQAEVWSPGKNTVQPASEWMAQRGIGDPSEDELTDPDSRMDTIPAGPPTEVSELGAPGPPTEVSELGGVAPKPPSFNRGDLDRISAALQEYLPMVRYEEMPDFYIEHITEIIGRLNKYLSATDPAE